ncbi:hypothetical protein ACQU0X_00955 [Pseudovibrio ascidiaceicola]|uniref:hypothetical protein n=1 Tax=Pseudovibrio ascidiaceicola TaxID=285279 RepID=UPI003D3666D9
MAKLTEYSLKFVLPNSREEAFSLSDAVYAAGFCDAVVGSGKQGFVAVALDLESKSAALKAGQTILPFLPFGSGLWNVVSDHADCTAKATQRKLANVDH